MPSGPGACRRRGPAAACRPTRCGCCACWRIRRSGRGFARPDGITPLSPAGRGAGGEGFFLRGAPTPPPPPPRPRGGRGGGGGGFFLRGAPSPHPAAARPPSPQRGEGNTAGRGSARPTTPPRSPMPDPSPTAPLADGVTLRPVALAALTVAL